jgi:hypothetical protein
MKKLLLLITISFLFLSVSAQKREVCLIKNTQTEATTVSPNIITEESSSTWYTIAESCSNMQNRKTAIFNSIAPGCTIFWEEAKCDLSFQACDPCWIEYYWRLKYYITCEQVATKDKSIK